MSKSSVIPVGAVIELWVLFPNNPSTNEPSRPVVIDGAVMRRLLALTAPAWPSTGARTSTPPKAEIPPVAPAVLENVHV
jgi:hypothetical protein